MSITVYSKPHCPQCALTKRKLDALSAQYTTIDLTQSMVALDFIMGLGYRQAPVVVVRDEDSNITDHWSGFRPDRIKKAVGR